MVSDDNQLWQLPSLNYLKNPVQKNKIHLDPVSTLLFASLEPDGPRLLQPLPTPSTISLYYTTTPTPPSISMRFEVPVSEIDSGDELDQLLFDYLGSPIHPPTEAKGKLQLSMASTSSAPGALSDGQSHESTPRSARRSARAKIVSANVDVAPSDASPTTDPSLIPFENALNAFRNRIQNSEIE